MEPEPPFFCLEPEPTQVGRSWSRPRNLGHPEPPKKVASPQHCPPDIDDVVKLAGSVSDPEPDPDPDSGGLLDPDPDLESGSGSRGLKKDQKC